jgi:hypothetical protein
MEHLRVHLKENQLADHWARSSGSSSVAQSGRQRAHWTESWMVLQRAWRTDTQTDDSWDKKREHRTEFLLVQNLENWWAAKKAQKKAKKMV